MKLIILFILFIICSSSSFGQFDFNEIYHDSIDNFSRANAVIQTSDSNFLVVGNTSSLYKMNAVKISKQGDTLWTFVADLGLNAVDYLKSAIEANDGNYIVVGVSGDPILLNSHADLIKLDKNTGDTIWVRKIGLPDRSERFYCVKQTDDKGFIAAGLRYNVDNLGAVSDNDVYLVKTDSMGIPEWEHTYGGASYDFANSIEIADDGGFMLFGTTYSYGVGTYNMYLIKTDNLGNFLWQKTYGGILEDYGTSICKLHDGSYVLAGSRHISNDTIASFLLKIDLQGIVIWEKSFLGSTKVQEFFGTSQFASGYISACGYMQINDLSTIVSGTLYKLDETDGSIIWQKLYNYSQEDSTQHYFYGTDVCQDGGAIMAGMYRDLRSGASPVNSIWVVKTDCMGNDSIWDIACDFIIGLEEIEKDALFNLYPNSSTGAVTVDYFIPQNAENQSISFYDATGKLVQKVDFTGEGQIQLKVDCSGFSNGVYQCVLVSGKEVMHQCKLVIVK